MEGCHGWTSNYCDLFFKNLVKNLRLPRMSETTPKFPKHKILRHSFCWPGYISCSTGNIKVIIIIPNFVIAFFATSRFMFSRRSTTTTSSSSSFSSTSIWSSSSLPWWTHFLSLNRNGKTQYQHKNKASGLIFSSKHTVQPVIILALAHQPLPGVAPWCTLLDMCWRSIPTQG